MTRSWIKPNRGRVYHLFARNVSLCQAYWRSQVDGLPEEPSVKQVNACKACWRKR